MTAPWSEGPKELLQHAVDHLALGGDFDRRIAMISTDNAVELMITTYLGLPKRIRGEQGPTRRELEDSRNSFPAALDLLEKYFENKLTGVNLEEIEWYHRIRNEVYHAGHGVTVELARIQTYLELAVLLFHNLFDEDLKLSAIDHKQQETGKFLSLWNQAELLFRSKRPKKPFGELAYYWNRDCLEALSPRAAELWDKLSNFRNIVVHDLEDIEIEELKQANNEVNKLIELLEEWDA